MNIALITFIAVLNLTVTVRSIIIYLTYTPKKFVLAFSSNKNDICFGGRHDCQERHTSAY